MYVNLAIAGASMSHGHISSSTKISQICTFGSAHYILVLIASASSEKHKFAGCFEPSLLAFFQPKSSKLFQLGQLLTEM